MIEKKFPNVFFTLQFPADHPHSLHRAPAMRSALIPLLATTVALLAGPAQAQNSLPAVDGLSSKLSVGGGTADGNTSAGVEGALTFPLGHRFGMQLDIGAGTVETPYEGHSAYQGGGAHVFWRDPSRGMVGVEAGYTHLDAYGGVQTYSAGVEAERYLGSFTLTGVLGMVDTGHASVTTSRGRFRHDGDRVFVAAPRLTWYPHDNLALSASGSISDGDTAAGLGVEYGLASDSRYQTSVFARSVLNDRGELYALAGVTLYFGQRSKPLIRRHREDDPPIAHVKGHGYLAGLGYALGALYKFRQHKDNPPAAAVR